MESLAEKDLGVLVGTKLNVSLQSALAAKKVSWAVVAGPAG